jgi:hypothetical protein
VTFLRIDKQPPAVAFPLRSRTVRRDDVRADVMVLAAEPLDPAERRSTAESRKASGRPPR